MTIKWRCKICGYETGGTNKKPDKACFHYVNDGTGDHIVSMKRFYTEITYNDIVTKTGG